LVSRQRRRHVGEVLLQLLRAPSFSRLHRLHSLLPWDTFSTCPGRLKTCPTSLPQRPSPLARQPLAPAVLSDELVIVHDLLAARKRRLCKAGERPALVRAPVRAAVHLRMIDGNSLLRVEDDNIRVA